MAEEHKENVSSTSNNTVAVDNSTKTDNSEKITEVKVEAVTDTDVAKPDRPCSLQVHTGNVIVNLLIILL